MQSPKRYLETISNDNEYDLPETKSPEELVDRFGIRISLLIMCVGLFIAALWMVATQVLRNVLPWKTQPSATPATTTSGLSY
jgi:hypothetical protein